MQSRGRPKLSPYKRKVKIQIGISQEYLSRAQKLSRIPVDEKMKQLFIDWVNSRAQDLDEKPLTPKQKKIQSIEAKREPLIEELKEVKNKNNRKRRIMDAQEKSIDEEIQECDKEISDIVEGKHEPDKGANNGDNKKN